MLVFWSLLIAAALIGRHAGDRHDRKAIAAILIAAALTAAFDILVGGRTALAAVAVIDIGLFAYMVRYALRSQRHWPAWFAGIHGAAVAFGLAALFAAGEQRTMLEMVSAFWSLPALLAMVAGLLADQRRGIANA